MPLYSLSNRQRKEYLDRGTPLLLAIPAPAAPPDDPLAWARSVLDLPAADVSLAHEEAEDEVTVTAPSHRGPRTSVASTLGAIQDDPLDDWTIQIPVVVVKVSRGSGRHKPGRLQWPAGVTSDGRSPFGG